MLEGTEDHLNGMYRIIQHCVGNHNEGFVLASKGSCNLSKNEKMAITGRADSYSKKNKDDCKRVLVTLNHV